MFLILFVTFCRGGLPQAHPREVALLGVRVPSDFRIYHRGSGDGISHARQEPDIDGSPAHMHHRAVRRCCRDYTEVGRQSGGDDHLYFHFQLSHGNPHPHLFPLMIDKAADISFIAAFMKILYGVCIVLLVPMLLAFIVKHTMKRFHHWLVGVKDLSYYLWGGSLMIVTGTTVKNICNASASVPFLLTIASLGLIVCIIQFSVGRFIGHYFDSTVDSGQALGQKNTAFAIWIAYTYLNPPRL